MSIQLLDDIPIRNRAAVLRRLAWIEDRLWWHGTLRRAELAARFGISPQQASQDISMFQRLRPGFAVPVPSTKSYIRRDGEAPLFPKDPFRWIVDERAECNETVMPLERIATPARRAASAIMAALINSFETRQSLNIEYQSMSSPEPTKRVICIHHIIDTGRRYHIRAWDDLRARFADFVVGRIVTATPKPGYPWVDEIADRLWQETTGMMVAPGKGLSPEQTRAVERDYDMNGGQLEITVRKALVTYVAEHLGVLDQINGTPSEGGFRELRCLNPEELAPFVPNDRDRDAPPR
jgi:predicted DNA-binding transcriptional regulator YafY